ncbi:MAG: hypothetical protein ACPIOQ_60565, partial [Promethearchaeia archaeon]
TPRHFRVRCLFVVRGVAPRLRRLRANVRQVRRHPSIAPSLASLLPQGVDCLALPCRYLIRWLASWGLLLPATRMPVYSHARNSRHPPTPGAYAIARLKPLVIRAILNLLPRIFQETVDESAGQRGRKNKQTPREGES